VRDRLAEVSGDRAFADDFVSRYIAGRDAVDYGRLVQRAGLVLKRRNAGAAWPGDLSFSDQTTTIADLVAPGTPAYDAGLEQDDVITSVDGRSVSSPQDIHAVISRHKPGDRISIAFTRRSGPATATLTMKDDPSFTFEPVERTGGILASDQKAFRDAWLGSHRH
jgi:S1-C subfamily serine protease